MKYVLNLSLVFDVKARALTLKNDPHLCVDLSKPATRLLSELIVNNHITLARDDIIRTVWTDYGFTPSEASLSNHISELRKAFESLGLNKEIIVTVPRTGFRLEANIHPVVSSAEIPSEISTEHQDGDSPGDSMPDIPPPVRVKYVISDRLTRYNTGKKTGMLALGVFIAMVAIVFIFMKFTGNTMARVVFTSGKCQVYNISNKPPGTEFVKNASTMMNEERVNCEREAVDIYYSETRPASQFRVIFMAVCYSAEQSVYQYCTNYKKLNLSLK